MQAEEGARLIAEDILREAKRKAAEVIQKAKQESAMLLDSARLTAKEEEEHELKEALSRGKQIREELMAKGRVEAKKEMLQKKEELIDGVFKKAEQELQKHATSKRYEEDLLRIATDACRKLGASEVIIKANPRDLELLRRFKGRMERELSGEGKTVHITFGEPIQTLGGVKGGMPDGKVEIDETFEGRLNREFESLRVRVARVLFE